jgi:shikimate dehydrogenase
MTDPLRRACVMGYPIAQSRSPLIHRYWLQQLGIAGDYEKKEVRPEDFEAFVRGFGVNGYVGGNVTIPHKEAAFRLAARRDPAAEAIGAVNVLWTEGGMLHGGNSDTHGFIANLDEAAPGWQAGGGDAVVLGAGGAARAAAYAFLQRGVRVRLVNRTRARAEDLARHFGAQVSAHDSAELPALTKEAAVLVNCTSCGMTGKPALDFDLGALKTSAVVYDIVYVPLQTALLAEAQRRGHRTADGLGMLLHQAGYGFEKWFGAKTRVTRELRALIEADLAPKPAA